MSFFRDPRLKCRFSFWFPLNPPKKKVTSKTKRDTQMDVFLFAELRPIFGVLFQQMLKPTLNLGPECMVSTTIDVCDPELLFFFFFFLFFLLFVFSRAMRAFRERS